MTTPATPRPRRNRLSRPVPPPFNGRDCCRAPLLQGSDSAELDGRAGRHGRVNRDSGQRGIGAPAKPVPRVAAGGSALAPRALAQPLGRS
jgi:hypothetical protein